MPPKISVSKNIKNIFWLEQKPEVLTKSYKITKIGSLEVYDAFYSLQRVENESCYTHGGKKTFSSDFFGNNKLPCYPHSYLHIERNYETGEYIEYCKVLSLHCHVSEISISMGTTLFSAPNMTYPYYTG